MDTNVIRITNENDSLILKDNEIHAFTDNNEHVYNLSTLSRLKIISSSSELDNIEKYLVLYIGDDTAIFINSDHIGHSFHWDMKEIEKRLFSFVQLYNLATGLPSPN